MGTRSVIEELFAKVANHTLFITLLAKNFVASGLTPTDMLKYFSDDGMAGISTNIIRHQKDRNVTSTIAGHFEILFRVSDLTDTAKNVLACLSMLGAIRINKRELTQICDCTLDTINQDLIERGWIQYDSILEEVSMHPIVSTTTRNILNPTFATVGILKDYLDSIMLALHYTNTDSYYPFQPINTLDQVDFNNRVMFLIEFFKHLPLNDPESLEYIAESLFDLSTVLGIAPDGIDIDLLYDKDLVERITDFLSDSSVSELTSFMAYGFGAFVWVESLRTIYTNDNEQQHVVAYKRAFDYFQKSIAALKQANLSVDSRKQYAGNCFSSFSSHVDDVLRGHGDSL